MSIQEAQFLYNASMLVVVLALWRYCACLYQRIRELDREIRSLRGLPEQPSRAQRERRAA